MDSHRITGFFFNPTAQILEVLSIPTLHQLSWSRRVMSFVETDNRQLLVGVWGEGIYRYDLNMNNIPVGIKGLSEKNGYSAWDMCRKSNGEIWMGLQGGSILVYDQAKGNSTIHTPPIIQSRTIRQVVEDKFGNMWFGTHSIGLFKWSASDTEKKFEVRVTAFPGIPKTLIAKLMADSKGYLWVCTVVDGIYKIDTRTDSIVEHITSKDPPTKRLLDNSVGDVMEYNDSTILIVSNGLNIYNTRRNTITHISKPDGLSTPYIMCMEKDRAGNLWLGMINGLVRLDLQRKNFSYYDRTDGIRNDKFKVASSYLMKDGRYYLELQTISWF